MRTYIEKIVGKQIANVIVTKSSRRPREQVYLIFSDGTYFELFGEDISCASGIDIGDVDAVVKLVQRHGCEEIMVYPEPE
jgi:hypothetical protein